jgi:hypothetical protein
MKLIHTVTIVVAMGLISSVQVKALILLPSEKNLKSPNLLPNGQFQHMGEPKMIPSVPEPSDWALVPVLGTIGFLAWRRLRPQPAV